MKKTIEEFKNSEFAKPELESLFNELNSDEQVMVIRALNAVDAFEAVATPKDYHHPDDEDNDGWWTKSCPEEDELGSAISSMADDYGVPLRLCKVMRAYSHPVYAGEKDSFGWVTACMSTRDGDINLF